MATLKDYKAYVSFTDPNDGSVTYSNIQPADEIVPELEMLVKHFTVKRATIQCEDGDRIVLMRKDQINHD